MLKTMHTKDIKFIISNKARNYIYSNSYTHNYITTFDFFDYSYFLRRSSHVHENIISANRIILEAKNALLMPNKEFLVKIYTNNGSPTVINDVNRVNEVIRNLIILKYEIRHSLKSCPSKELEVALKKEEMELELKKTRGNLRVKIEKLSLQECNKILQTIDNK